MPFIQFYISSDLLYKLVELVEKKYVPDIQSGFVIAINVLVNVIKFCEENDIDIDKCLDKLLELMFK